MSDCRIRMRMNFVISFYIVAFLIDLHSVRADINDPFCSAENDLVYGITCGLGYDCRVGRKAYKSMGPFTNYMVDTLPVFKDDTTIYGEYCDCKESDVPLGSVGMTDTMCTTTFRRCEDDHICFNDAPCKLKQSYACDCSKMNNDFFTFEGDYCEIKTVVKNYCPPPTGYAQEDFYCTNGGTCKDSKDKSACDCPFNYSGARCENRIKDHKGCDLQCTNGGACVFADQIQAAETNPYGDLDIDIDTSVTNMQCRCPYGFLGTLCEVKVQSCGANKHFCLNYGRCVEDGDQYTCECDVGARIPYAGDNCQHKATTICEGNYDSFCTNHGVCKNVPDPPRNGPGGGHPGCFCSKGFHGEYCEHGKESAQKIVWIYMGVLIFIAVIVIALLIVRFLNKNTESKYSDPNVDAVPESERMHNVDIS